jgi:hypothetical protein
MAEDARWDTIRALVDQALVDGHDAGSPVGDAEIEAAERELGAFPEPYRQFVREFGWLEIAGCTVYGLGDDVPAFLDVVRETLAERQDFEPGLDDGYIAIGPDGAGNLWCVETAAAGDPAAPVLFRDHERSDGGTNLELDADDFVGWLLERLEAEL